MPGLAGQHADASTRGARRHLRGCGTRRATPTSASSPVFDVAPTLALPAAGCRSASDLPGHVLVEQPSVGAGGTTIRSRAWTSWEPEPPPGASRLRASVRRRHPASRPAAPRPRARARAPTARGRGAGSAAGTRRPRGCVRPARARRGTAPLARRISSSRAVARGAPAGVPGVAQHQPARRAARRRRPRRARARGARSRRRAAAPASAGADARPGRARAARAAWKSKSPRATWARACVWCDDARSASIQ